MTRAHARRLALLAAAVLCGCGGASPRAARPEGQEPPTTAPAGHELGSHGATRDLLRMVSQDAYCVARVDVAALWASPYAESVRELLNAVLGNESSSEWSFLAGSVDEVVVAAFGALEAREIAIIARGSFRDAVIEQGLRQDSRTREKRRGDHTAFVIDLPGGALEIARLSPGVWAGATPDLMELLFAHQAAPEASSAREAAFFRVVSDDVGFDQATAALACDVGAGERANASSPNQDGMRWAGSSLTLRDGAALRTVTRHDTQASAGAFAAEIRQSIAELRSNPLATAMLGIGGMLARTDIAANGDTVTITSHATGAEVSALLERARAIVGLVGGGGLGIRGELPAVPQGGLP